ncbi:MAG: redox-regulated ATPase YchF [Patescibacteria group bacterium]
MSFSIGIVGLPNVGKSTLFTALTKQQVDAANYPFCTIDPNVGTVAVPDDRLDQLARVCSSAKVVPTVVEFVDIAGLVAGAHRGEGLGNQFLSHIRTVDAICEVVRQFADPNVVHVAGRVDPASDQETIKLELVYADLATVEKRIADTAPKARSGDTVSRQSLELYEKVRSVLNAGTLLSEAGLSDDERLAIRDLNLLTAKPVLYVLNVGESAAATPVPGYVVISAKVEAELSEMSPADALEFLRSLGLQKTGLDQLISAAYRALNLVTFFAAGPTESRAWTVERGSTIQQAAGKIHTDFERAFVRAEVIGWQDFVRAGSEAAAKAQGLMHLEGRGYLVQDGDTVYIHANA